MIQDEDNVNISFIYDYVIVEFIEEQGNIDIISSSWLFEENDVLKCFWPMYLKSSLAREKAVRNHVSLHTEKCWKGEVKATHYFRDYNKAKEKLRQLEEQSDSESARSAEPDHTQTRRLKPNKDAQFHYEDYDSAEECQNIPKPPSFPKSAKSYYTLKPINSKQMQSQLDDNRNYKSKSLQPISHQQQKEFVTSENTEVLQAFTTLADTQNNTVLQPLSHAYQDQNHIETFSNTDENLQAYNMLSSTELPGNKCDFCKTNHKAMGKMYKAILEIKNDIKTLLKSKDVEQSGDVFNLEEQFHFTRYQQLVDFDSQLGEEEYYNKMRATLALLGGRDMSDTVRKLFSVIMTNELAQKVNWIGMNNKGSLQKLANFLKLVHSTVRKNRACPEATNQEINISIRNWIKNAPDREGGRKSRKNRQDAV